MSTSTSTSTSGGNSTPLLGPGDVLVEIGTRRASPPPASLHHYKPPFIGLIPSFEWLLLALFHVLTSVILFPLRLLVAIFISPLISPKFKGQTPAPSTSQSRTSDVAEIPSMVASLRADFSTGATRSHAWREQQLLGLQALLIENDAALFAAYQADIGKVREG